MCPFAPRRELEPSPSGPNGEKRQGYWGSPENLDVQLDLQARGSTPLKHQRHKERRNKSFGEEEHRGCRNGFHGRAISLALYCNGTGGFGNGDGDTDSLVLFVLEGESSEAATVSM